MNRDTAGINRRSFLSTIGVAMLATPFVAQAQPAAPPPGRLWRVGVLFQAVPVPGNPFLEAIVQGFHDLGYVEGRHLTIEVRYAGGDLARLPHLAQELVRLPVDIIMTPSTGIDPAMAATTTIPIVMLSSSNPVEQRQVQSIARPGGNVTGMAVTFDSGRVKWLQLLKEASPKVSRVGWLTQSSTPQESVLNATRHLPLTVFLVPLD